MTPTNTDSLEFKLGTLRAILQNAKEQLPVLIEKNGRESQYVLNHISYLHGLYEAVRVFDGPTDILESSAEFYTIITTAEAIANGGAT